jgi:hypothetical protein
MDDPGLRRIALVTRRYGDLRAGVSRAIWAYPALLLAWMVAGLIDLGLLFKALPHRPEEAPVVDAS